MSSSSGEEFKAESCRSYLITYSQADTTKVPTCRSFVSLIENSFGALKSSRSILEWACCQEPHSDSGVHYHMAINLSGSRRWLPLRNYLAKEHGISVNFSTKQCGYVAAYRYVCKDKPIESVLHSENHTNLMSTPKTMKAMKTLRSKRSEKRRSLSFVATATPSSEATPSCSKKPKRMTKEKVAAFLLSENIRTEEALYLLAKRRKERGEPDIYNFLLNTNANVVSHLVNVTWKIENVEKALERKNKVRIDVIREIVEQGDCIEPCAGMWYNSALEVLRNNKVNLYLFAAAMRQALQKGRQKKTNALIIGPTNCGKSFLFNPLEIVYKAFVNPANNKYCWIGLDECEIAYLNDFRWSTDMISWSDLINLLEGQTVNLPRPKNLYATDLTVDRSNTIPFFATSKSDIEFVGKYNSTDKQEDRMMSSRWMTFEFTTEIASPKHIDPCGKCFAKMVMAGYEF